MTVRTQLLRVFQQEDINFLLTNRIPRRLATQFVGWLSQVEQPLVRDVSMGGVLQSPNWVCGDNSGLPNALCRVVSRKSNKVLDLVNGGTAGGTVARSHGRLHRLRVGIPGEWLQTNDRNA